MLNFRNVSVVFSGLLIILLIVDHTSFVPWWTYVIPAFIFVSLLVYGSVFVSSNFYLNAICEADTNEKKIAITFDDGPVAEVTTAVLDVLKEKGVPATFFCIGNRIAGNEHLLKRMQEEGHIVGNHSYSHAFWFDLYSAGRVERELRDMETLVEKAIGRRPLLFRPPYGVTNPPLRKATDRLNYKVIGWNVRSLDTSIRDEEKLLKRVMEKIKPGSVVLFHDSQPHTISTLKKFLGRLKEEGYQVIALDKLLNVEAYA